MNSQEWDRIWQDEKPYFHHQIIIDTLIELKVKSALEIGAGSGLDVEILNKEGIATTFLDQSQVAVDNFKKRNPDLKVIKADAFSLPFKDNEFDIVYSLGLYHYFDKEQRNKLFEEMNRVSKRYILIDVPQKFSPLFILRPIISLLGAWKWKFEKEHFFSYWSLKKEINSSVALKYGRDPLPLPRRLTYKLYNYPLFKLFFWGVFNNLGVVFNKKV